MPMGARHTCEPSPSASIYTPLCLPARSALPHHWIEIDPSEPCLATQQTEKDSDISPEVWSSQHSHERHVPLTARTVTLPAHC